MGGTGLVGRALLDVLEGPRLRGRHGAGPARGRGPRRRSVVADLDKLRAEDVPGTARVAFCCLGTTIKKVKGEMERDLAALGFETACAYHPSLLRGEREEPRPGERLGVAAATTLRPLLPRKYRGIPAGTVARDGAAREGARARGLPRPRERRAVGARGLTEHPARAAFPPGSRRKKS